MSDLGGRNWTPLLVPVGAAVLLTAAWFAVTSGPRPQGPPGTPEGAVQSCQEAVRQRLANPGTATFSTVRWDRGATVWLVSGGLSAEAADGSLVEGRFDCEAIETSGEVVTLVLPSGL
ncbi:hypothetical protein [Kineosporia sp. R_H_3]|uniref:hypothetical protein n=1 Tax=Kineosporia sp. R_H_3 TaxID=1961848 RepID=UPI000B4AE2CF|nr:hypothetical protein [Kineosporia sp. R_H_3]